MRVLIDTNVALTYLSGRNDRYADDCREILRLCASQTIEGYLAFHSLSTIWYVTRKAPDPDRRGWLKDLCTVLNVAGATRQAVLEALNQVTFKDFEDALQDCCAQNVEADYLITANIRDFEGVSKTPAVTPDVFLEILARGET